MPRSEHGNPTAATKVLGTTYAPSQVQSTSKFRKTFILIKDARLKQGERLFEGYRINYDTARSIITGRGDPLPAAGKKPDGKPGGRIKVIIPPKTKPAP